MVILNDLSRYDYLIVGSGIFGCVAARELTDRGRSCLVTDKRPHIGGNVYCEDIDGITVHKYGAHIFHTDSKKVWDYVNRFVRFLPYEHRVTAKSGGESYSLPFNMNTFRQIWGAASPEEAKARIARQSGGITEPSNLEEQAVSLVGRDIYEKLVKGYTEKQWGKDCRELPASIIKRLPLRFEYDDRYFTDKYQGIPQGGYNVLTDKLLEGIPNLVGMSYQRLIKEFPSIADKVIFTGPIDEFFEYRLGRLEYRSLRFEEERLDIPDYQGQAVVNYCDSEIPYTRIIEHKHFTGAESPRTVITREYPAEWQPGQEAYYPINDERNNELYRQYRELAREYPNIIFAGRLGEYKYYDMDDTVAAALELTEREAGNGL